MSRRTQLSAITIVAAIGLSACGGAPTGTSSAAGATTAASAAIAATPEPSSAAASSPNDTTLVEVNTATEAQLQAAFEAAGIPNADRWAREVAEYRPYPDDPTWAKLRQELGKYNIDPLVLEQIIALLQV